MANTETRMAIVNAITIRISKIFITRILVEVVLSCVGTGATASSHSFFRGGPHRRGLPAIQIDFSIYMTDGQD